MDEIVLRFKQGKFQKCLELIKVNLKSDTIVDGFVIDNCYLICKSLGAIMEKDIDKMNEVQEHLYLFFDKVTSVGMITEEVPFQIKLTATFNFVWWLLFYVDEMNDKDCDKYLEIINGGLLRVLGKKNSSLTYSNTSEDILANLYKFKKMILLGNYTTSLLILELSIVIFLYILKTDKSLVKKCVDVINAFVVNLKKEVESLKSIDDFMESNSGSLYLFKFGLDKMASLVSELDFKIVDFFYLLESALLFSLKDYKGSLKSLKKNVNCTVNNLWNYIGALDSFELNDWSLCLGFLNKCSLSEEKSQEKLKARLSIMYGKLCWVDRNYKESLKHFENALLLLPKSAVIYYYIGQDYGKMGLYDLMVDKFEKLLDVVSLEDFEDNNFMPNFENTILEWFHPPDEITQIEALYALAAAYGLNEEFDKARETFEKIIRSPDIQNWDCDKGVIEMPDLLTILHEASVMNLLTGNLLRAEQIAVDALERYCPKPSSEKQRKETRVMSKDIEWLTMTIQHELLENDLEPKELKEEIVYPEELVYFLPENVIALLIISEIQRIQGADDYKVTLGKILTIFSKYLSSMVNKKISDSEEAHILALVKGLAGKTSLRIADLKMKEKDMVNIEKMFKRALSCNKGDKDALFSYYTYLSNGGRSKEARSLWSTFYPEKSTISEDSLQSFSLRYFFNSNISKREIEKICNNIELMNIDTS